MTARAPANKAAALFGSVLANTDHVNYDCHKAGKYSMIMLKITRIPMVMIAQLSTLRVVLSNSMIIVLCSIL
jgi:hypothetical protein